VRLGRGWGASSTSSSSSTCLSASSSTLSASSLDGEMGRYVGHGTAGATNVLFGDLRPADGVRVVGLVFGTIFMLALMPVELARWVGSGLGVGGGDDWHIVVYCWSGSGVCVRDCEDIV
jgi:hypothetical protein